MILQSHKELRVYQSALDAAMEIFLISKSFPVEERYSLVDQLRRASRSVCTNIGEAWRRRRYRAAFIAKINDCENGACETQIWIKVALRCDYISAELAKELNDKYDHIISQLVMMINDADKWIKKDHREKILDLVANYTKDLERDTLRKRSNVNCRPSPLSPLPSVEH